MEEDRIVLWGGAQVNSELLHRREQLLQRMVKGITLTEAAEGMTKGIGDPFEREKQVASIVRDWGRHERWIENVVRLNEGTFLAELVAGMDEAMKHCWVEYYRAKNPSARVGALRTIIGGKTRQALILMKAGIIEQAPQKVDSTLWLGGTPFDLDPELKKALVEEAQRQRGEKASAESGASRSG